MCVILHKSLGMSRRSRRLQHASFNPFCSICNSAPSAFAACLAFGFGFGFAFGFSVRTQSKYSCRSSGGASRYVQAVQGEALTSLRIQSLSNGRTISARSHHSALRRPRTPAVCGDGAAGATYEGSQITVNIVQDARQAHHGIDHFQFRGSQEAKGRFTS